MSDFTQQKVNCIIINEKQFSQYQDDNEGKIFTEDIVGCFYFILLIFFSDFWRVFLEKKTPGKKIISNNKTVKN